MYFLLPLYATLASFLVPGTALAAETIKNQTGLFQFQPIVPLPLPTGGILNSCTSLGDYVNAVFQLAITVSITLAVIMIIIDGFKYMTSEAAGNKKDALQGIRSALFGLVIILACTLILNIINPNITKIKLFSGEALQSCSTETINNINISEPNKTDTNPLTNPNSVNLSGSVGGSWCFQTDNGLDKGKLCFPTQSACNEKQKSPASFATTPCTLDLGAGF